MTAISPVGAAPASPNSAGLDFQSLLQIILTQLTYQDPLQPMDNFQFVSQLAQFSQLQQSQALNDTVQSLLAAQAATQATSLLGRTVDATTQATGSSNPNGSIVSGTVQSVSFASGSPQLTIKRTDGSILANIAIANVQTVR